MGQSPKISSRLSQDLINGALRDAYREDYSGSEAAMPCPATTGPKEKAGAVAAQDCA
jgi:hypothetical protein